EIAFQARADRKIDRRSGVSQRLAITCLENVLSNAERRALVHREHPIVARVTDVYAALPSITGKFELEYEGELKGADNVARELIRGAVSTVFDGYFPAGDFRQVIDWFEMGGNLQEDDAVSAAELLERTSQVQGLHEAARDSGFDNPNGLPYDDDEEGDGHSRQSLHDAILEAILNGGMLSEVTLERLLGKDWRDSDEAEEKLDALIDKIIEKLQSQGYLTG